MYLKRQLQFLELSNATNDANIARSKMGQEKKLKCLLWAFKTQIPFKLKTDLFLEWLLRSLVLKYSCSTEMNFKKPRQCHSQTFKLFIVKQDLNP